MILSAIAAMASNRVIGKDGTLPWKIPEDFKFFKTKTSGHIMIMGRKTFESLPGLLPNRLHVVITRQENYAKERGLASGKDADLVQVFSSIAAAVAFCKTQTDKWGEEVFIIGGGDIYKEMLSITDRIYLTEIHQPVDGDAKFPEFSLSEFKELERLVRTEPMAFDFVTYQRKS